MKRLSIVLALALSCSAFAQDRVGLHELTDTWNASGTEFDGIKLDVTNSASAAASDLIDLQIGGATIFGVNKSGEIRLPEAADHGSTVAAAHGYIWVKNDTPSALMFTADDGTDYALTPLLGGGGGSTSALYNVVEDVTPQLGGDLDLNGSNLDFPTTANISDVIDDDTMAAASATTLATSESIKAYADLMLPLAGGTMTGAIVVDQNSDALSLSIDAESTTADVIDIASPATTTGNVMDVAANALTTGKILDLTSSSADASNRTLVNILNDNPSATNTTLLNLKNDSTKRSLLIDQDGNGIAIEIDAESTTADVIEITAPGTTTGCVLDVNANALTTGKILDLTSASVDTSSRELVRIHNDDPLATGAVPLYVRQDSTGDIMQLVDGGATVFSVADGGDATFTGSIALSASETVDGIDVSAIPATYVAVAGDTMTGNLTFGFNDKTVYGTANAGSIYYSGSAFIFDSQEGGTNDFLFNGGMLEIAGSNAAATSLTLARNFVHTGANAFFIDVATGDATSDFNLRIGSGLLSGIHVEGGTGDVMIGANATPDGTLHVMTSDASATGVGDLIVEHATVPKINLLGVTDGTVAFGDVGDADAGRVYYNHTSDYMGLWTGGTEALRIDSSQDATFAGKITTTQGAIATTPDTPTLGVGVTTYAVDTGVITLTGDGGGNALATLTGGVSGQLLTIIFVDANITVTDTDAHTANTVDLAGTATNLTSADDTVLQLVFTGTSWYEVSRSTN